MIQDIYPSKLNNNYIDFLEAIKNDLNIFPLLNNYRFINLFIRKEISVTINFIK